MRLAPEAIDDPQLDPFDRGKRRVVEFGNVGRVGKTADPQTEGRAKAMVLHERDDRNPRDFERAADLVRFEGRLVIPAGLGDRFKDIAEAAPDFC